MDTYSVTVGTNLDRGGVVRGVSRDLLVVGSGVLVLVLVLVLMLMLVHNVVLGVVGDFASLGLVILLLLLGLDRRSILLLILFLLLFGLVSDISAARGITITTHPAPRTAKEMGPSLSICSLATRYLATSIRRSFQTSIISS